MCLAELTVCLACIVMAKHQSLKRNNSTKLRWRYSKPSNWCKPWNLAASMGTLLISMLCLIELSSSIDGRTHRCSSLRTPVKDAIFASDDMLPFHLTYLPQDETPYFWPNVPRPQALLVLRQQQVLEDSVNPDFDVWHSKYPCAQRPSTPPPRVYPSAQASN